MPSLLDIAPPEIATETVAIRGVDLVVRGLPVIEIAKLMKRFPDIRKLSAGREVDSDDTLITGIEAAPAIIAAGLVEPIDEAEIAKRLRPDEQALLVETIMRLTNPPEPAGPLAETPRAGSEMPAASSPPNGAAGTSGAAQATR